MMMDASTSDHSDIDSTSTNGDEPIPRSHIPIPAPKQVKFKLGKEVRKYDSVDSILDKIDSGIYDIKPIELPMRSKSTYSLSNRCRSRTPEVANAGNAEERRSRSTSPASRTLITLEDLKLNLADLTGERNKNTPVCKPQPQPLLNTDTQSQTKKTYSAPHYRSRFSSGRLPAHHMSAPNLESGSICTEDFETLFANTLVSKEPGTVTDNDSLDTPRTEEFEQIFKTSFVKTSAGVELSTLDKRPRDTDSDVLDSSALIRHKITGVISDDVLTDDLANQALDTVDEMSDLEPDQVNHNSTLMAHQISMQYDASSESELDTDIAREIREESTRIQREIELERRANKLKQSGPKRGSVAKHDLNKLSKSTAGEYTPPSSTIHHQRSSTTGALPVAGLNQHLLQKELARSKETLAAIQDESSAIKQLTQEKMKLLEEVSDLQAKSRTVQDDIYMNEHRAKENRTRAEESRSQLMLAEFKKEAANKELERLTAEIEALNDLQGSAAQQHAQSVRRGQEAMDEIGITPEEVSDLIAERNQLRALVEKRNVQLQLDKDELEKQLSRTKQEMFGEQRNTREKFDSLEEKTRTLKNNLDQAKAERDENEAKLEANKKKCEKLEQQLKATESTSMQAILDRDRELEVLREQSQRDLLDFRMQLNNELSNMKKTSKVYEERCLKQEQELRQRDIIIDELRCECSALRAKTEDEGQTHEEAMKHMQKQIKEIDEQKQKELKSLKQQYELDQANLLSQAKLELNNQHEQATLAMKEDYDNQISQLQTLVHGKDEEVCLMRSRLQQQEEATKNLAERLRIDAKKQMDNAVKCEREMWEKEHEFLENQQLKHYRHEVEKQMASLKDDLETEQRKLRQQEDQYRALKSELEDQRNQNNRLYEEKVEAANRSKQQAKEEANYQIEKIRQQLEEEADKTAQKLKAELVDRDEELHQLKAEIYAMRQSEDEICLTLEKMEKMIISEINEECRKTAHLLDVTPRKTHSSGFSPKSKEHKKARTMAASAIANLRACNEELRNTVRELREDSDTLNIALNKTKKSKELELNHLRKQLTKEKTTDMDDLKLRLTQVSSSNGHTLPNEKSNQPYLMNLDRKLSEKAMHRSLRDLSTKNGHSGMMNGSIDYDVSYEDSVGAARLQRSVQERLRQLRIGTPPIIGSPIRRAASQPEHINVANLNESSSLEQRVKLAELKAHLAEDRAARNQSLLNSKLQEVNQLQSTLNSQTKEILSLERSFDELRHSAYSPTRPGFSSKTH